MNTEERFESLWTNYLEGDLDEAGRAELRALLAGDEQLLRRAADAFQTHRLLGFVAQADTTDAFVTATLAKLPAGREQFVQRLMQRVQPPVAPAWTTRDFWRWAATGLAAAACVALAWSWFGAARTATPIATLIFAEDAAWSGAQHFQEGQRLPAGVMKLARGTAAVRFDGGASVLLRAGCELELESIGRARLIRGAVVVRAPEEAAGFVLRTPAREVVDLGTEFAVNVEDSGATEVRVLEGEIALHQNKAARAPETVLGAGAAVRFARADAAASPAITAASPRFEETIRAAQAQGRAETLRAFEGFGYAAGAHAPGALAGGHGWAGPWRLRTLDDGGNAYSGTTRDMVITEQRRWEAPAGKVIRLRPLAAPLDLARDGITYVSLVVREPERAAVADAKRPEGVQLGFRSSARFNGECLMLRLSPGLRPMIETGMGQGFVSRVTVKPGQTLLLVAKIVARRAGEDEISLRVFGEDEALEAVEPATWDVTSRGVAASAQLDLLVVQSSGVVARQFGDLRIGPTWRSVARAGLNDLAKQ